jgi:enhanced filamentous growth protein 1
MSNVVPRIPFERALDFANKEKITELLYPLFVHNIGALLYHPTNQSRTTQVMAAAEQRRKQDHSQLQQQGQRMGGQQPPSGLPSLQQHHHHSMTLPPQPPVPSQGGMDGRPSIARSHTFPTPPTSATAVMGGMGSSENFQWSQNQGTNPMPIDTSLSNARSMPATPASTPPNTALQSMQPYPPATQAYDSSRQLYNAPPSQQSPYPPANSSPQDRNLYGQSGYVKSEMGPPSSRPTGGAPESQEAKSNGMMHPGQGEHVGHHGEEEAEHEHDAEYTHDSGAYDSNRNSYNYNQAPVASLPSDHPHLSPEMTGPAGHQGTSGRSTPRSAAAPQSYYPQQGYNTPPRAPTASSNLYSVMSSDRGTTNGANDVYAPPADMGSSMQNGGYAPVMNGASGGMKRGRDDEDDRGDKRRKTVSSPALYDPSLSRQAPAIPTQRVHR